ncbi:hypothetical protein KYY02_04480 [Streptomyces pimonensis]|uniref:Uncharacterized protein n=1 Tax=Streptomyces pimonensis TaxID=2860288 RepID=A0ABV4ITJ6_9ACTN
MRNGALQERRVHRRAPAAQERRVLAALVEDSESGPVLDAWPDTRLTVRGGPAFTAGGRLEWPRGSEPVREQMRDLCARALLGVLTSRRSW